ncbi:prepilin-type N-terminal cleavage/methylation domain-containing protein [Cardiobacteriaceae bacterium TAE3-ERU3]|nr:prepilin-type N-terminal cleavage/methylation domain-containing protein [Cardiobacteriaceae bacterium TAE3-ERU3]
MNANKICLKNRLNKGLSIYALKNKGMAMLEVIVAMLIVGVAVLPLVFLQVRADRGVIASYTKTEHNAIALSIMDLISADANKKGWVINLVSGECDLQGAKCDWRAKMINNLLIDALPNAGSSLVCINGDTTTVAGNSITMNVKLWWFSAGRGSVDNDGDNNQTMPFSKNDCANLDPLATKWNIDTVEVTRIF